VSAQGARRTRNAGFVACLIGVLAMLTGRFVAGAPVWLVYVGVSVIVFGWGLLALSIIKRMRG
jgi:energy-coupling factor transporter transmembrane protein EcfT